LSRLHGLMPPQKTLTQGRPKPKPKPKRLSNGKGNGKAKGKAAGKGKTKGKARPVQNRDVAGVTLQLGKRQYTLGPQIGRGGFGTIHLGNGCICLRDHHHH